MSSITDLSNPGAPEWLHCEVCVIGSGCGGATAARVLAEAGLDVVVLEEGGDFTNQALTQRDAAMYDQLYVDRGGRTSHDGTVSILSGRVLGGGGVVNASDVVPVPDAVWRHWQQRYGLSDFSPEAMRPFTQRALEDLSAKRIREDQVNRANAILRQGAQTLGWRGEVLTHNRADACQGLGTCMIGCPIGAKRNPRMVAIPKAMAAGARFFTRARALRIEDGEVATVYGACLDARGFRETGRFAVRAKVVVVAANPVGTVQLLLRSHLGNEHVGRSLSLQPQVPILAVFDEPVDAFRGIPQSYAVTEFERCDEDRGLHGFRIEGIMGTPGIVGSLMPQAGHAGKALMTRYRHVAAALLLLPDESVGTVTLGSGGRPHVHYELTEDYRQRARQAMQAAARLYLAAGAREVVAAAVPPVIVRSEADLDKLAALSLAPATMPLISAHQQGGVRMAPNARDGAANPDGLVHGTRGVYVMDASGFPSTSSSHTMAPILTVAHLQASKLAAAWRTRSRAG